MFLNEITVLKHYTKQLTKLSSITFKHVKLDAEVCSQTDKPSQKTNNELFKQYVLPEDFSGRGHQGHKNNNNNKITHV